jgi:hypothetical protein
VRSLLWKEPELRTLVRFAVLLLIVVGIGMAVTKIQEQKERFLALTEDEQRQFLADRLGDKVPEGKLAEIQDAVFAKVNAKRA